MLEDSGEVNVDPAEQRRYHGANLGFTDWELYILAVSQTTRIAGTSFSTYSPSLTQTLGYNITKTLLLTAPPWVFSCFVALANTWHSDRQGERYLHHAWPLALGIVGFVIAMVTVHTNVAARYTSLFLMASSYARSLVVFSWLSSPFPRPPAKRAVVVSFMNAIPQLGAVGGSYVRPSWFGPSFRKSFGFTAAMYGATIILNLCSSRALPPKIRRLPRGRPLHLRSTATLAVRHNSWVSSSVKLAGTRIPASSWRGSGSCYSW